MITTILFDLDGTLVPMDQEIFVKDYFTKIAVKMAPLGYNPKLLLDATWKGTAAMIRNDGSKLNAEVFWEVFASILGERVLQDKPHFDEFYEKEFDSVKAVCGYNPQAAQTVHRLKKAGYKVALATNPVFPTRATELRIGWAGLQPEDFELFTTYDNIGYCKPNTDYFREVARRLGVQPEECLMVGNDVSDDMPAEQLGMKVFLLTDCLINKDRVDISRYPNGNFDALNAYADSLNR